MLDFPESGHELWRLFDEGGPRPEYVLPVLWSESNFDPTIINSIGCAGVNQACPDGPLGRLGVDAATYASWPASEQIRLGLIPHMMSAVSNAGPLRSATRVYQANFLPATLPRVRTLTGVLSTFGDYYYGDNANLDYRHKGTITVDDLAHFIQRAAKNPQVQAAISHTYALRPGERPRDPVLGEDFGGGMGIFAAAAGIAVLLYAVVRHS